MYEAGEHPTLSLPAKVDVAQLFKHVAIVNMQETTLSGAPPSPPAPCLVNPFLSSRQCSPLPHNPPALDVGTRASSTLPLIFTPHLSYNLSLQLKELDGTVVTLQPNTFRTFRVILKSA